MDFIKTIGIDTKTIIGKLILVNIIVYVILALAGVVFFSMYGLYGDALASLFFLILPGKQYNILYVVHFIFGIPILLIGTDVLIHGFWWELITSMFLHANIVHIGFNMFALKILGDPLEKLIGGRRVLLTFLLSGIVGNILTVFSDPHVISLGASGGVFGVAAAISFIEYRVFGYTRSLKWLLMVFIISSLPLAGGLPNIIAHFGGLATGALLGLIYADRLQRRYKIIEVYY